MSKHIKTRAPTANISPFGLRMPPEIKSEVEQLAKVSGRSMNAQIVHMLQWCLDEMRRMEDDYAAQKEYEEHIRSTPVQDLEPLERFERELHEAHMEAFRKLVEKHGLGLKHIGTYTPPEEK